MNTQVWCGHIPPIIDCPQCILATTTDAYRKGWNLPQEYLDAYPIRDIRINDPQPPPCRDPIKEALCIHLGDVRRDSAGRAITREFG